jgi:hypothetical protein
MLPFCIAPRATLTPARRPLTREMLRTLPLEAADPEWPWWVIATVYALTGAGFIFASALVGVCVAYLFI